MRNGHRKTCIFVLFALLQRETKDDEAQSPNEWPVRSVPAIRREVRSEAVGPKT